jgi:ADP-heptose:LPS heptosyltransferase
LFNTKKIKAYLLRQCTKKTKVNFDLKKVKSVLFLRYDRIGDMIITTPVIRELKAAYPDIKISILASNSNQAALKNNPYVDEVFVTEKNRLIRDLIKLFMLRNLFFDVCIEFDHSVVPHAILRLLIIRPKIIISVIKEGRYDVQGCDLELYDYFTEKKKNSHFRDIWLQTLTPFGVVPKSNKYDLFCTNYQIQIARSYLKNFPGKFIIGINLQGAVKGKKISFLDLYEICKGFQQNKNIQIVILSSPENHQLVSNEVSAMDFENVKISYKTESILDVASLISQLDLIITPDTSITHIASTFNKPIVTIHEKNFDSFKLFAPTSDLSRTVFSEYHNKLEGFSVDAVLDASNELIEDIKN